MPSTPVPATGSRGVAARGEAAPGPAIGMGWRGDLVTAALAAWLIVGLFVDGWAHNTRPLLETFFTPWHALFYSGFASLAAWSVWRRAAVPPGYGLAVVGLALLFGPLVWLARRWRLPAGAALLLLGVQVLLLRPGEGSPGGARWRVRVFALAAPAAFWGVYLAGIGLHDGGLGWAPELWGGALVWSSLTLLGLTALLLLPPAAGGSGEARG